MYHIVASDLDGTLLSPDHVLSPYTKQTLKALVAKGIHFVFATGRHHMDVEKIRNNLGINAYMITSNGARVHDEQNNLIYQSDIADDIARDLFTLVENHPLIETHVYKNDGWLINRESHENISDFFKDSAFSYHLFDGKTLSTENVCKIYYICEDPQPLSELENKIKMRWGKRINASFSTINCLEIMNGEVSKGNALDKVAKLMGHSLNDCIAFGDGMNDLEMLSMAGKGCIMENADPRLKSALPKFEVIGNNSDHAVAKYLSNLYL